MGVQTNASIVLTFTEVLTPLPSTILAAVWHWIGGRSTAWTVNDTVATITHNNFAGSSQVAINITTATTARATFAGALTGAADPSPSPLSVP